MASSGLALRHGHMMRCDHAFFAGGKTPLLPERFRARVAPPRSAAFSLVVVAGKIRKGRKGKEREYPWPDKLPEENKDGSYLSYLSRFKPLTKKPKQVLLPFEKPIAEIEKKINEVKAMQKETGLDFDHIIGQLESEYEKVLQDLYENLTPIQRLTVARHPNRPTCLDHVQNMSDKWVELHGDRAGYDDPAIVTGIGSIDGMSFMFIGHQKGRNTKENIHRNFAMPTPHGYRKALRIMEEADLHGFPIVTFIDTPGAYADIESEQKGQGESIAQNLRSMFGLKVPIISVVIGEGGSGGALAIGCCNKMLMLENSVYYVASPEACAAILYKSAKEAPRAARRLKITAQELVKYGIADEVIPEPLGGAHKHPLETSKRVRDAVMKHMHALLEESPRNVQVLRYDKFRRIGKWTTVDDDYRKRNMMKGKPLFPEPTAASTNYPIPSLESTKEPTNGPIPSPEPTNGPIAPQMESFSRRVHEGFQTDSVKDKKQPVSNIGVESEKPQG